MALLTAIVLLGAITFLLVVLAKWRHQYWSRQGVPQLKPHLVFGNYKPIIGGKVSTQDFFLDIYKNAKAKGWKQVGIYNLWSPEWLTLDLDIIKRILVKDFEYFPGHGFYHNDAEPLSEHLFNLEGEEWKKLRTKLTPTFTTGKMKMMFETLLEKTHVLSRVLDKQANSEHVIQIKETLARFSTDIIGSVAFGIECNSMEESDNKFRRIGKKALEPNLLKFFIEEMIPFRLQAKLGHRSIDKEVDTYFTQVVKETIAYREMNNIQRKDFMSLMLQMKKQGDKNSITDQEIITESYLFYLAGFETSSSASTFAIMELSQHQQVQDKLRKEIHEVLEKHGGKIGYDALMEMEYLDRVLRESLRKYPPLVNLPRLCAKTYKVPDSNVVIEKGTRVHIPAWGIQMDPEYYPNPEQFNPDNFTPENVAKRPDFTWMPFGEGPRMCIGMRFGLMQSKVALITLLKDYKFTPHEDTPWPLVMDKGAPVMSIKGDVWVKINKL